MGRHAAWGAALLRVVLGLIFVLHGYYAYATLGPAATAGLIGQLGYPEGLVRALAWYLVIVHAGGGFLLLVGLWTAAAAVAQVPIMASAVFLLHWPQGFFMHGIVVDAAAGRAIAGGYEYALLVPAATLALILIGPGAGAIDGRRRRPRHRSFIP